MRSLQRVRGFTLLEVIVSLAIMSLLVFVMASSFIPVSQASSFSKAGLDVDREGRALLSGLRKDLRQTGYDANDTLMLTLPAPGTPVDTNPAQPASIDLVTYRVRTGPLDTDWGPPITIRAIQSTPHKGLPTPLPRYRIERLQTQPGVPPVLVLATNVSRFRVELPAGDETILLRFEVTLPNPVQGGSRPPPVTRVFEDQVLMLNRKSS